MIRTILRSIIPAIAGLFIGSWSDLNGRKPLLMYSSLGFGLTFALKAIICQLNLYYNVNPWYFVLASIPESFMGGHCVLMVGVYCFISDITDVKSRPYR